MEENMTSKIAEASKIDIACQKYKLIQKSQTIKFEKIDNWLYKESSIFEKETLINTKKITFPKFKRGQIIKADFGINIGSELSHTHFAIVLNHDDTIFNDNITVIPITSKNGYKRIELGKILIKVVPNDNKYNLNSYANITQIKTISKKRIYKIKSKYKSKYICEDIILDKLDIAISEFLTKIN